MSTKATIAGRYVLKNREEPHTQGFASAGMMQVEQAGVRFSALVLARPSAIRQQ